MHHAVTLEALRILKAIQEKGSFAAAADSVFKVPSALTYTIQKLESDLDVKLFDRRGQKAVLTAAGQLVLNEGLAILHAADNLEEKVRQLETGWETQLRIAKDTIIPITPLLNIISEFCQLDKVVEVSVIEEALGGGWDALYSGRADIGLGLTGEIPRGQYNVSQIGMVEFVFAVSASHPLADYAGVMESKVFSQYPSIVVADSSRSLPVRSSGIYESKQRIRVSSMQTKLEAQISGLGTGFLPLHIARPALQSGALVAKSVSIPRPPMPVYMASEKHSSGKAQAWFCDALSISEWFA